MVIATLPAGGTVAPARGSVLGIFVEANFVVPALPVPTGTALVTCPATIREAPAQPVALGGADTAAVAADEIVVLVATAPRLIDTLDALPANAAAAVARRATRATVAGVRLGVDALPAAGLLAVRAGVGIGV